MPLLNRCGGSSGGRFGEKVNGTYVSNSEIVFEFPFENCIGFDIDSDENYYLDISPGKFYGNLVVALWYPLAPEKYAKQTAQSNFAISTISFDNNNGNAKYWYSKIYLPSSIFELYVYENKVRLVSQSSSLVFTGGNYRLLPIYSL